MCEEMVDGTLRLGAMTPGEFVREKKNKTGDYKQNPVLKELTRKGAKEKIRGIVREWESQASIEETKGNMFQGQAVVRPTKNKTENV